MRQPCLSHVTGLPIRIVSNASFLHQKVNKHTQDTFCNSEKTPLIFSVLTKDGTGDSNIGAIREEIVFHVVFTWMNNLLNQTLVLWTRKGSMTEMCLQVFLEAQTHFNATSIISTSIGKLKLPFQFVDWAFRPYASLYYVTISRFKFTNLFLPQTEY